MPAYIFLALLLFYGRVFLYNTHATKNRMYFPPPLNRPKKYIFFDRATKKKRKKKKKPGKWAVQASFTYCQRSTLQENNKIITRRP